jgi:hypothetical protein
MPAMIRHMRNCRSRIISRMIIIISRMIIVARTHPSLKIDARARRGHRRLRRGPGSRDRIAARHRSWGKEDTNQYRSCEINN